jgi:chemotaxis protein MotB
MGGRRSSDGPKINTGAWLNTYADLMNNLLVFFMLLYVMSIIDLQKFKKLSTSFVDTFLGTSQESKVVTPPGSNFSNELITIDPNTTATPEASPGETPGTSPTASPEFTPTASPAATESPEQASVQEYDALFDRINLLLEQKGYADQVSVEKKIDVIYLRFREGVFFYADSPQLKPEAYAIIDTVSNVIMGSYDLISGIDISGHTAKVRADPPSKTNLFSWDLSTDRALTVLKYLVQQCDMPQDKLSITGYSCNQLYVEGDTEEFLAQNRRVEIRLTRNKETDVSASGGSGAP